jgi:hypothetical protein
VKENKVWRYKKLNPDSKISIKMIIIIVTAVETSNLTSIKIFENNFSYDSEEETRIE